MIKHICLDCNQVFDVPAKQDSTDITGHDDFVLIDVCPVCMSNHIQHATGLYLPVLDAEDLRGLQRMCETYTKKCIENKINTTDATLLHHYTALIDQATGLIDKIIKSKQA